jgi:DNA-binding transcriptional regulator YdaS (Cro superfamily)
MENENKLIKFFGNQNKTAIALGVTRSHMSKYANGKGNFSVKMAKKASKLTDGQVTVAEILGV